MIEELVKSPKRILLIDDQETIHEDFRKILLPTKSNSESLQAREAELFGCAEPVVTNTPCFHIDSAMGGQEGLDLAMQACDDDNPYSRSLRRCSYAARYRRRSNGSTTARPVTRHPDSHVYRLLGLLLARDVRHSRFSGFLDHSQKAV